MSPKRKLANIVSEMRTRANLFKETIQENAHLSRWSRELEDLVMELAEYDEGQWIRAEDVNRHTRVIDIALNGAGAAPQASLCDIASQLADYVPGILGKPTGALGEVLESAVAALDDGYDYLALAYDKLLADHCSEFDEEGPVRATLAQEMAGEANELDRAMAANATARATLRFIASQYSCPGPWAYAGADTSAGVRRK